MKRVVLRTMATHQNRCLGQSNLVVERFNPFRWGEMYRGPSTPLRFAQDDGFLG
jgi:hypothetical protein